MKGVIGVWTAYQLISHVIRPQPLSVHVFHKIKREMGNYFSYFETLKRLLWMVQPGFQAEMKKGKDETEDKVYSWVGRQMKIQITDNRILVGNGLTPISSDISHIICMIL